MEKIKGSKILFVLPDIYTNEEYEKVLSESCKYSEYELVSIKDFNENPSKYLKVSTVVAEYDGVLKTIKYTNPNKLVKQNEYVFIDVKFYVIDEIKVGKKETKYEKTVFGQISFCPDYGKLRNDGISSHLDIAPNYLRNYNLGYLKNYFTVMSNNLSSRTMYDGYADVVKNDKLRKLKKEKLYIIEDVKQKNMGAFNREGRDLNELTVDYPYEKEFISADEVSIKNFGRRGILLFISQPR